MRIAVFSDIHSNLQALEAVIEDAQAWRAQVYLVAGDVVGYGASPNQCIEELIRLNARTIAGNHDWGVVGKTSTDFFNSAAHEALRWTSKQLTPLSRRFLEELCITLEIEGISLAHANFISPSTWDYVSTLLETGRQFKAFSSPIGIIGHSHVPFIVKMEKDAAGPEQIMTDTLDWKPDQRVLVNAGSVGQPRDGDARAAYLQIDLSARKLILRRVAYDVTRARRLISQAGLPLFLAERLSVGR